MTLEQQNTVITYSRKQNKDKTRKRSREPDFSDKGGRGGKGGGGERIRQTLAPTYLLPTFRIPLLQETVSTYG